MRAVLLLFTIFSYLTFNNSLIAGTETKDAESYLKNTKTFFIENIGQIKDTKGNLRDDIKYYIKGNGMDIYFRDGGISYVMYKRTELENGNIESKSQRVDLEFGDGLNKFKIIPYDENLTKISFLKGELNLKDIKTYSKLIYENVAEGIDLVYYPTPKSIKYDFVVKPNADLSKLKIKYNGINSLEKVNNGSYKIKTDLGDIFEEIPLTYQIIKNEQVLCSTNILIEGKNLSYNVENYNHNYELIIDPILYWATFAGGAGTEIVGRYPSTVSFQLNSPNTINFSGGGVVVDDLTNTYITGSTSSTNFPWSGGTTNINPDWDIFINKYDSVSNLVYSRFIGGDGNDFATDIDLNSEGNPVIIGATNSSNIFISLGQTPYDISQTGGEYDMYLYEDDFTNGPLARCINGTDNDYGRSLKINKNHDRIYIIGDTESSDFEQTNCNNCTLKGNSDVIVASISSLFGTVWTEYYGGNADEIGMGIDHKYNEISIVGATNSELGFDLTNAFQTNLNNTTSTLPTMDGYVARMFENNSSIIMSSYIGGEDDDYLSGIAYLDSSMASISPTFGVHKQFLLAVGFTKSDPIIDNFYTIKPPSFYRDYNNGTGDDGDGLILQLNNYSPLFTYYYGGSDVDVITDVSVKIMNEFSDPTAVVQDIAFVGYTNSEDLYNINSAYRQSEGPIALNMGDNNSNYDAFVAQCDHKLKLISSSFYGSIEDDFGAGIYTSKKRLSCIGEITNGTSGIIIPNQGFAQPYYGGGASDALVWNYLGPEEEQYSRFPTFFGGTEDDYILDMDSDIDNNIYITGITYSSTTLDFFTSFPTTAGAYDETYNGNGDIFISKFNKSGVHLFTTYVGGSGEDAGVSIKVEDGEESEDRRIFVAGYTESSGLGFGLSSEYTTHFGDRDGFVLGLSNDGSSLLSFTYIGSSYNDEATSIDLTDEFIYVSGFMNMNQNSMLPGPYDSASCNSPYGNIYNKWNYNSIYCREDAISKTTRDGDTVGFITKWDKDLELKWGDWIRDQAPYNVKALDVSVMPNDKYIALVGTTNGGDYILPSLWTSGYTFDSDNNSNYSNGDLDGWIMVIKDEDSTRFAEWGNLVEGVNDNGSQANDVVNNVEWIISGIDYYDIIIAGHTNTDEEDFDQFSLTVLDPIEYNDHPLPKTDNDIFMLRFNYVDTTYWNADRVAFYGEKQDDQMYDMYYNYALNSIVYSGITKSFKKDGMGFDTLVDFTRSPTLDSINNFNQSISNDIYHGFVIKTTTGLNFEWGSFFGDDLMISEPTPADFFATAILLQNDDDILITGNSTFSYFSIPWNILHSLNYGGVDGFIARINTTDNIYSKKIKEDLFRNYYYDNSKFSIYPNPASESISISNVGKYNILDIVLYTNTGLLIKMYNDKLQDIDISSLSNGIYHFKISYTGGVSLLSFVKNK